ncbi:alpha/beta fold hydrolase [Nonomuraea sp. NPDC051941]|uniref:alpha/beta fold hydrolase n=1 Tax=Nonomuraea sp. NPDC051941 TaxID=3364373 RepID=UPI0037C76791
MPANHPGIALFGRESEQRRLGDFVDGVRKSGGAMPVRPRRLHGRVELGALEAGESVLDVTGRFPDSLLGPALRPAVFRTGDGEEAVELYLKDDQFPAVFAADLPRRLTSVAAAAQRPIAAVAFEESSPAASWKTLPSWYVVAHYTEIINALDVKPILIGHSFGGMIAEKLLGQDLARAAIAIDAAQIKGVLPLPLSALRSTLPVFKNPANKHRAVSLTLDQFTYAFGNAIPAEEAAELYERWTIPAPGKPLFEAAAANFSPHSPAKVDTGNNARGPLLLIAGGKDHTVPETVTKATLKQYRGSTAITDFQEFPDRGHSLTIDHGWREVADACLTWLTRNDL